jgi:nucleoside-diphosphate-sugar epimerase
MKLHTILGAGGAVAGQLAPLLLANNERVRLIARNPQPAAGAETVAADVTDYQQVLRAVEGSSIVYLLVGLKYDLRAWRESWPRIMTNVINACRQTGSALIFFDNVYMYGHTSGPMTEETPFHPTSKKGAIRSSIATQLLHEMEAGTLRALIARAADFYGPGADKSGVPNLLVFDNLRKGKKAQWLGRADQPHSFTYVPDTAKALYLLAGKEEAFGQTWHLPTAPDPLTGRQFIEEAARAMGRETSFSVLPTFMLRLAGLFDRTIGELAEMNYQFTHPYLFDSSKFNKAFNYQPVSYAEGIKATAGEYMSRN